MMVTVKRPRCSVCQEWGHNARTCGTGREGVAMEAKRRKRVIVICAYEPCRKDFFRDIGRKKYCTYACYRADLSRKNAERIALLKVVGMGRRAAHDGGEFVQCSPGCRACQRERDEIARAELRDPTLGRKSLTGQCPERTVREP